MQFEDLKSKMLSAACKNQGGTIQIEEKTTTKTARNDDNDAFRRKKNGSNKK